MNVCPRYNRVLCNLRDLSSRVRWERPRPMLPSLNQLLADVFNGVFYAWRPIQVECQGMLQSQICGFCVHRRDWALRGGRGSGRTRPQNPDHPRIHRRSKTLPRIRALEISLVQNHSILSVRASKMADWQNVSSMAMRVGVRDIMRVEPENATQSRRIHRDSHTSTTRRDGTVPSCQTPAPCGRQPSWSVPLILLPFARLFGLFLFCIVHASVR